MNVNMQRYPHHDQPFDSYNFKRDQALINTLINRSWNSMENARYSTLPSSKNSAFVPIPAKPKRRNELEEYAKLYEDRSSRRTSSSASSSTVSNGQPSCRSRRSGCSSVSSQRSPTPWNLTIRETPNFPAYNERQIDTNYSIDRDLHNFRNFMLLFAD